MIDTARKTNKKMTKPKQSIPAKAGKAKVASKNPFASKGKGVNPFATSGKVASPKNAMPPMFKRGGKTKSK